MSGHVATCACSLLPEENLGVVVLENLDHAESRHALLWKVIDLWTGTPEARDWSSELLELYTATAEEAEAAEAAQRPAKIEGTRPSIDLAGYAGTYRHPIYDDASIILQDGELRFELGPGRRGRLEHWNHDSFEIHFDKRWQGEGFVTFELGPGASPTSLGIFGLTFDRVPEEG